MKFLITPWQEKQASSLLPNLAQLVAAGFCEVLGIVVVYPPLLEFTKTSGRLGMPREKTVDKALVLIEIIQPL